MVRKKRGLSQEDRALWARIQSTVEPLGKHQIKDPEPSSNPILTPKRPPRQPTTAIPKFVIGANSKPHPSKRLQSAPIETRLENAPLNMDQKTHGKIKRGKLAPEARLDLHGLTLEKAQPRLVQFILSSQMEGKRLVLVITGKGKDRDSGGPIPQPRGMLRHQVPNWLALPPCAGVVLQVTPAHLKHGGTGAYYVYLRRLR